MCVDFDARKKAAIEPGGGGTVSPDWLVLRLIRACDENNETYALRGGGFNSLFRLSLIESDERTAFFLTREIPCASVSFPSADERANAVLTSFVFSYTAAGSASWDRHYILLPTNTAVVNFDERFIVLCFMIISFVSLFILCEFSFIADKKTEKKYGATYCACGTYSRLPPLSLLFLSKQVKCSLIFLRRYSASERSCSLS